MQWLLGNLFLLSVILVTAGLWWLYGACMWRLGLPPDEYRMATGVAAICSVIGGALYCRWALNAINKREWDKALGRRK